MDGRPAIVTPKCPLCGSDPMFPFIGPMICPNPDCKAISWDPYTTVDELLTRVTFQDLSGFDPPKDLDDDPRLWNTP